MTTRSVILEQAAELLAASPSGDVSTRAVCEAAGVTQPVLYRLFGDKDGLLAAVVDYVWEQYLAMKRDAEVSSDPLQDLYAGWDSHVEFGLAHPHAYRLLFGTVLSTRPDASNEAMSLLRRHLDRLASHGRLRLSPDVAAAVVMAANTGVTLGLLLRPEQYPDPILSETMRDTLYRSLLVDADTASGDGSVVAATTLRASLADPASTTTFTTGEAGLLDEWLTRIQTAQST